MLAELNASLERARVWLESLAAHRSAPAILFLISFIEAALFPIPPDVLLIALGLAIPRRAIVFGLICAAGSFLGGFAGYYFGLVLFDTVGLPLLQFLGVYEAFEAILAQYRLHGFWTLVLAGFTPIPYVVFTFAAGFNATLDLGTLTIGALIGRTVRFGLVGVLLFFFGPPVKAFIEKQMPVIFATIILLFLLLFAAQHFLL